MIIACCGCEVSGEDAFKGYWWKKLDGLSCGNLCPACVPIYRAVEADSYEEAEEKLADSEPVTLIDILEGQFGGKRETKCVGGTFWDIYEVPAKEEHE